MAFDDADAYQRFMGRFSNLLAPRFADVGLDVGPSGGPLRAVLDVGCGPGVLTRELVRRVGAEHVAAVDPAASFVEATTVAMPGVDVRVASAEHLPFADGSFDATLAQLVVQFMTDPAAGVAEMARVTRPGGRVSACVWDHGGGLGPLSWFWRVATDVDPGAPGEGDRPGTHAGQLSDILQAAGLDDVRETSLAVALAFTDFEDWYAPYSAGVGPVGDYLATLDDDAREHLEAELRRRRGPGGFDVEAVAWCGTGVVPDPPR